MLLTAAALRDQGKFDESDALYSRFTETFPRNPIAVSGILGRASNARVSGHADAAVSSYQQAAAAFPQSYGAPFALLSEARLLAQLGKTDEAKRVIQALASQYSGSVSIQALGVGPRGN
jgi:TolA-binding protein